MNAFGTIVKSHPREKSQNGNTKTSWRKQRNGSVPAGVSAVIYGQNGRRRPDVHTVVPAAPHAAGYKNCEVFQASIKVSLCCDIFMTI